MSFQVPDFPPEDMAPNGQPDEPEESVDEVTDSLLRAIKVAAENAATSEDPEAFKSFGAGAFYFAQSVEKLLPQKPSPDAQLKAESAAVLAGGQQAHEQAQAAAQRAHEAEMKQMDLEAAKQTRNVQITRDGTKEG